MKWQMVFDGVSKSGDTKEKVVKKFAKLETYLGKMKRSVESGFVTLSKGERWGYKVKTMFRIPGQRVIAEGKSETLLSAIDQAYAKAAREVKQRIERIKNRKKH